MNAIKEVINKSKKKQKEVSEITGIKQSTLSTRMNKDIQGTIEWSLEVAKELNVKSYSVVKNGYKINIKRL
jgi:predicted XRE-type DNA-binding protein